MSDKQERPTITLTLDEARELRGLHASAYNCCQAGPHRVLKKQHNLRDAVIRANPIMRRLLAMDGHDDEMTEPAMPGSV